jgi:hypothetical protein
MMLALALYACLTVASWLAFRHNNQGTARPVITSIAKSSSATKVLNGVTTLENGDQLSLVSRPKDPILENLPSVDYYACCGLGHRLIRMSSAAYVARHYHFELRSFWGWCGEEHPVEVFSHLFRPLTTKDDTALLSPIIQAAAARQKDNPYHNKTILHFYNEVPGFRAVVRRGGDESGSTTEKGASNDNNNPDEPMDHGCACRADKVESDVDFYTSLRQRYRDTDHRVETMVQTHFVGATVLGLHVRAGNGEEGDFVRKGRVITNPQIFVRHVSDLMVQLLQQLELKDNSLLKQYPPILYIATDTSSIIDLFRTELQQSTRQANTAWTIPVLDLPQERRQEGEGVLFGESDKVHNKGPKHSNDTEADDSTSCLRGWRDTTADMILLSHADVVIAGKPSSFSQTLPMSLAFGKRQAHRKIQNTYCELIPQYQEQHHQQQQPPPVRSGTTSDQISQQWTEGTPKLDCFADYMDWCCNHSTWIKFSQKKRTLSKEFVVHPTNDFFLETSNIDESSSTGSLTRRIRCYPAMRNRTADCLRPRRGRAGGGLKDKCLPHEW